MLAEDSDQIGEESGVVDDFNQDPDLVILVKRGLLVMSVTN